MSAAIKAMQKQTRGQMKNLTRSMGFKNTALGTTGVLDAYQKELDRALLKITTGVFSYDAAVNDCVKRLAESGLRSIDYASGRSYQLDTAARMCVRTGMSQLAGRITEMNLQQTGQDLVITSQHMGSRPEHAPWQNKVFSYSGKNKKYPDFMKETGYGTAEGLKGANCAHDFYPFWEGDVIPKDLTEPATRKINGKEYTYYQSQQQMRRMERGIRATKREIEAQHAIGGDVSQLKAKLTAQRKAYYDFAASADIRPKDNRLRIVAGSSTKTKKNSKKMLENTDRSSTMNLKDIKIHRSVGAKARNYDILDPSTGGIYRFAEGTKIQNGEVFAGKGTKHPLHDGVGEGLSEQYGGTPEKWQHCKGYGVVDYEGEERKAEVHWFQEETVGKVKFKIKGWKDED